MITQLHNPMGALADTRLKGEFMKRFLPGCISQILGERSGAVDAIGKSDSEIILFDDVVLKIEKQREESDNEHRMLRWLQGRLPVPEVIAAETLNGFNYLLMSRVDGVMVCDESCLKHPETLIRLLAEGLKIIWAVDISHCPCLNNLENKLKLAKYRVENNLCDTDDAEPGTFEENGFKDPEDLLIWLIKNKPDEQYVLSHGDYCMPNIFVENGRISGFIDLGRAGIADKWQDIALCIRSIEHNLGMNGAYIKQLLNELDMEPDLGKIRYYILLDELF